jgi:hypothetical protein
MQLSDILNDGQLISYVIAVAIGGFAILRALEMGKAFAAPLYRGRAYWTATLLAILTVSNVFGNFPVVENWGLGNISYSETVFVVLLLFVLVFVDRNLVTMREIDFFHRDTLRWSLARRGLFAAMIAVSAILLGISTAVNTNTPTIPPEFIVPIIAFFAVDAAALGYAALALVVGAKRTPDKTMRSFSKVLGIALLFGVLSFTIWIVPVVGNWLSALCTVFSTYALYRAVMTLSPVGKLEEPIPV